MQFNTQSVFMLLASALSTALAAVETTTPMTGADDDGEGSPFAECQTRRDHFWSPHFRSCLPCTPCMSTLVPCGPTNDAECDDKDTAIRRIRERVRNEPVRKEEFMAGLRSRRRRKMRRGSRVSAVQAAMEAEDREKEIQSAGGGGGASDDDEEVDGQVKYVATAPGDNSLHADIQEIERELYMERMGLQRRQGRDRFGGGGGSTTATTTAWPSPPPTDEPAMVLGKKRFYAASAKARRIVGDKYREEGQDDVGEGDEEYGDDDEPRDVYGAVIQNPIMHSTTPADDIGILHSLLLDVSTEDAAGNGG